jgi:DNA-binding NarL/FixJ family response regulator
MTKVLLISGRCEDPIPQNFGLEAMVAIRKESPEAKVIILTTYAGDAEGAMKLGAQAYLLKTQLDKELLWTIRAVHAGK